jgi:cell division septation protein DedD
MGYNTRVVPMDLPGKGRWYRLTIGGLSSHEKAKEAVANIEKKIGASKGFIRPEGE